MNEMVLLVLAFVSCVGVWIGFWPYITSSNKSSCSFSAKNLPSVSIILPVRNEAKVITTLLDSLLKLDLKPLEIIVVDDGSEDETITIAQRYPVKVMRAPARPEGWVGKNWACQVGAAAAQGSLLLFTDADTQHRPYSLQQAVRFLADRQAQMISAHSYHLNQHWWEKLLGPFYCLLSFGSLAYHKVTVDNAYAVGQYLLIDNDFYRSIGGHAAVYDHLAEDVSLAKLTLVKGGTFKMYEGPPLFEVQMYDGFLDFVRGWTRLLRLGMKQLTPAIVVLTIMPLLSFNFWHLATGEWIWWLPPMSTLICFGLVQQKMGRFSILGLLLFPLPVLLFVALACWASICEWMKKPIVWRDRVYFTVRKITAHSN